MYILQRYRGDFEASSHLRGTAWPDEEVSEAFLIKAVTDSELYFRYLGPLGRHVQDGLREKEIGV